MKTGIFISIFCHDNISNSLRYIMQVCSNISRYNKLRLHEQGIDFIINLDEFTYGIIQKILKQEGIKDDSIIYKTWERNDALRGMIWRFESFTSTQYDICINGEGIGILQSI